MGVIYPICLSCGKVPQFGLYDGFRLQGRFFCTECENRLVEEEIGSSFYLHMVGRFRSSWADPRIGKLQPQAF